MTECLGTSGRNPGQTVPNQVVVESLRSFFAERKTKTRDGKLHTRKGISTGGWTRVLTSVVKDPISTGVNMGRLYSSVETET